MIALFFIVTIIVAQKRNMNRFHAISFLLFLIPILAGYIYSIVRNPVLQNSVPVFSLPYLFIFLGSFLQMKLPKPAAVSLIAALFLFCAFTSIKDNKYRTGGFKFIAEKTIQYDNKYGSNCLKAVNIVTPPYINYYLERMNHPSTYALYNITETEHIAKLQYMLDTTHAQYFFFAYESCGNRHETEALIRSEFPVIADRNTFYVSGTTLYKRSDQPSDQYVPAKEYISTSGEPFAEISPSPITMNNDTSLKYEELNDQKEYSATFTAQISDLKMADSSNCYFSAWVKGEDVGNAQIVLSFERDGNAIDWVGDDLKFFVTTPGEWHKVIIGRVFPKKIKPTDTLKAYVWNRDKKKFWVHGMDLKIFPPPTTNYE
jgi:hypothetical protein